MKNLDATEIKRAFSIMGEFLRDKQTMGEIAIDRGSAILLQFDWRESTEDVDATVVSVGNHGRVRQAADKAASETGLERSWLSEAVAQYTSAVGGASDFAFEGLLLFTFAEPLERARFPVGVKRVRMPWDDRTTE